MSLSHTELSFGDFSGLSNEEYEKLFSTLSRPLSNRKVKFPWNEEEYVQSGIQALNIGDLAAGHQYLSQIYHLPTAEAGTNETAEDETAEGTTATCQLVNKDETDDPTHSEKEIAVDNDYPSSNDFGVDNIVDNEQGNAEEYASGSNTNNDENSAGGGSGSNGDRPRRRNKKKRDPEYYQRYYTNPELYNHHDHREAATGDDRPQQEYPGDGVDGRHVQIEPVEDLNSPEESEAKLNAQGGNVKDTDAGLGKDDEECASSTSSSDQPSAQTKPGDLPQINHNEQTMVLSHPANTDPIPPRTSDQVVTDKLSEQPAPADKGEAGSTTQDVVPDNQDAPSNSETDAPVAKDSGLVDDVTDVAAETGKDEEKEIKETSVGVETAENVPANADGPMHTANLDKPQSVTTLTVALVTNQNTPVVAAILSGEEGKENVSEIPENNAPQETDPTQSENAENSKQGEDASVAKPKVSSWAGLFKNTQVPASAPIAYVSHVSSEPPKSETTAKKSSDNNTSDVELHEVVTPEEDKMAKALGEFLLNVKFPYRALALQPRGLNNTGNWCYVNAILQALLSCPPMYNLLKSLPVTPLSRRGPSSTPMMDSLAQFVNEFHAMPPKPGGKRTAQDLRPGSPFEPNYVYRLLTIVKSSMSTRGRQEDAEEFLGFVLNGLHEEMLTCTKFLSESKEELKPDTMNGPSVESSNGPTDVKVSEGGDDEDDNDEEWEQVGPKNKSSITRSANFVQSSISEIFGGQMRSALHQHGSKESATLQPFFTLQLDIQFDKTWSVKDALQSLVSRETLHDYTSTKSKSEAETFRRITLEVLPPVLVLHLKRFLYDKSGGCQKLQKKIDYTVDLEISKDLLSPLVKNKLHVTQRSYKLFAIVYHHGKNASGGHYTCDFYHPGINGWVRTDDTNVKAVTINSILRPIAPKVPYLLFYRRCDLI